LGVSFRNWLSGSQSDSSANEERGFLMSFRTKFALVMVSAAIAIYGAVGSMISTAQQPINDPGAQLRIFENVLQHIQNDYVDEPNMDKVRSGAMRGLAYGLDPYSTYLTADQVRDYSTQPKSGLVGIGAELSQVSSYLYVIAPVKGSPAEVAGLRAGDVIEYIDTKATRDISLYDAKQLLNGAPGSEVKLRVLRSNARPNTITVKRGDFRVPAAETRMEANRTGVLKINSLADGESADVRARLQELVKQGAQKVVIDLRSVAGGSLTEAVAVANLFIKDGGLAQTIGREGKSLKVYNAEEKNFVFGGPVAVLIDSGTAGASEVVAAAISERGRGDLVGERSFGAGTDQQLFKLRDGDGLLLTTVKWASPGGKPFLGEDRSKSGIEPTVKVAKPDSADSNNPDGLGNPEDEEPNPQPGDKREVTPDPKPVPPAEDIQMKKALEILKDKTAAK
jgi:carboxyl-terminal processing protease